MLPVPRVTMQDVAQAAKVHQTTVSLALRNDPRLSAETRERIHQVAERLGYRPDPMLSALNFYRSARGKRPAPLTMGFLLNFKDRDELASWRPHRLFLEGARRLAEDIGYQLDVFYVRPNHPDAGPHVQRVLQARGITGVILAAFSDNLIQFRMDWSQFSLVLIESQQLHLSAHMISTDQMMITRKAVSRLHELGYSRVGLAVGKRGEVNYRNGFTAGYHAEVALCRGLASLPPLLLTGSTAADIAPALAAWITAHRPEVIASNWAIVPEALRLLGRRIPVASLDVNPESGSNAGMQQNHRVIGERAVEQLAILMRTNQRGLVTPRNSTLIEGDWIDGSDVPPCVPSPRRRKTRGPSIL